MPDKQQITRRLVKKVLGPTLRWPAGNGDRPGYSIVLGVPWALRHLLSVNLDFVARTDQSRLDRIFIVFDRRPQPGGREFIQGILERFPVLPLEFHFHPPVAGRIVGWVNRSKFYASLNWVTGLGLCRTRYAILHDFDLYPIDPGYFKRIWESMETRGLRFSGAELTYFDGLTEDDGLIGTWSLGVDIGWLRENHRPVDCFHEVMPVNGRRVDLDAFSAIQSRTPERGLAEGVGPESFVHVRNLVSTFLLFSEGKQARLAWRLHHLWYLESLAEPPRDLARVTRAMEEGQSPGLVVDGRRVDMSTVHHTCANVLAKEVRRTEGALFGATRPEIERYLNAFGDYLERIRSDEGAGS